MKSNAVAQYDAYRSIFMPTLLLDELLKVFSMFHNISHELVILLRSDVIKVPTMRKSAPVGLQKELKIHHGLGISIRRRTKTIGPMSPIFPSRHHVHRRA